MRERKDEYPIMLTAREVGLLLSLLTQHIRILESLGECKGRGGIERLPDHKEWFYRLEDSLEDYYDLLT
jgi:hypothetical protein